MYVLYFFARLKVFLKLLLWETSKLRIYFHRNRKKCKFFQKTREYRSLRSTALSLAEFLCRILFQNASWQKIPSLSITHFFDVIGIAVALHYRICDTRINISSSWLRLAYTLIAIIWTFICTIQCGIIYMINRQMITIASRIKLANILLHV